ncbi:MAG: gliding motility-associated C-terminal domain-containing protein, partial [Bacteroidia bacterium]
NGGGVGMYLSTNLDNANGLINSSPTFAQIPVTEFCVFNQFYFNQQANDPDGDLLVYSLVPAEDATTGCPYTPNNLAYATGFTATDPVTTATGVTIDTATGLISFVPTMAGEVDVVCVRVDEWRNGVQIGRVKRDLQIHIVANCIISPPSFDSTLYNNTIGQFNIIAQCGDTSVILAFQHDIQCGSIVPTDVRATDPSGLPNPILSATPLNCQNGVTDSILITFYEPLFAGITYLFTKTGNDGNTFLSECGTAMDEFDSIAVFVVDSSVYTIPVQNVSCFFTQLTVNFPVDLLCGTIVNDASDFHFVDAAGTNVPIISVTSNCNPSLQYDFTNTLTFTFASGVSGTGPYYLIVDSGIDLNTVANRCNTFFSVGDTLGQFNVTNNIIVNLGPDITVCASDPSPVINAGNPGTVFTWYYNGTLLPADTMQTLTADTSGQYIVTSFFSGTCQGTDTINVTIIPAPMVNLGPDTAICVGDLVPTLDAGNSGANFQWYFNGTLLLNDTLQTLVPDTNAGTGVYSVTVNTGGSCNTTDYLTFTINPPLVPNVGIDQTVCQNTPVTLSAGVSATSYQWFDQFGIIPGATGPTYLVNTGATGTYTFGVIATGPCQGTDSMTLIVDPIPNITLTGNTVACITDTLFANASGISAYQWYVDGVLSAITNSTFIITTADGAPHIYSVVASNGTCSDSTQLTVTVFPSAPVPTVANAAFCSGSTILPLDAGVTGTGYQYLWSTGETTQTIVPNSAGIYTVTVSLGGGSCTSSASATVAMVTTPQPSLNNESRCSSSSQVLILDPGVNDPSYNYQWYDNSGTAITGATNSTYTVPQPFVAGNYSVTITNTQNGTTCSGSASMTLTINPSATVSTTSDQVICEGSSASFTASSPNTSPAFTWSGPDSFSSSDPSISISNATTSNSGTYIVTVTDAGGCTGTDTVALTVNAAPDLTISASDTINNSIINVCEIDPFPLLTANAPTAVTYQWTFTNASGGINNNFSMASSVQVNSQEYGIYTVEVTDANLCTSISTIEVAEEPCEIIPHNVMTPNADGKNDIFWIDNIDTHPNNNVQIYNRWGNKVYDESGYNNTTVKFTATDLPDGTYYYLITAPDLAEPFSGSLTKITEPEK